MKTNYLYSLLMVIICLMIAGCVADNLSLEDENNEYNASLLAEAPLWGIEGTIVRNLDTKTVRTEDGYTYWLPGDAINVFQGSLSSSMFYSTVTEPSATSVFNGSLDVATGTNGTDVSVLDFWAIYPYDEENTCDGSAVTLTVKDVYTGTAGTFNNGDFPSVGTSPNLAISFYNVCSGLAFQMSQPGVISVTLEGNEGEDLAGRVEVRFDSEGKPFVSEVIDSKTKITLDSPDETGFKPGETYYMPVLPCVFDSGFKIRYKRYNVNKVGIMELVEGIYEVDEPVTLQRSVFGKVTCLDAEIEYSKVGDVMFDADPDYIFNVYDQFNVNIASHGGWGIVSPLRVLYNWCGDDIYAAGCYWGDNDSINSLNEFRHGDDDQIITNFFNSCYKTIAVINEFLELCAFFPEENRTGATNKAIAEARVLRAYLHMMLAIGWGTPPLADHVLGENESLINCDMDPDNPMSHKGLLEWCAAECKKVLPYLDERSSTEDKEGAYKVTKGFANAVAGKSYLFANNYVEAKKSLESVVLSGKYALVQGYEYLDMFHREGNGNSEKVFEYNIEQYDDPSLDFGWNMSRNTWMESNLICWRLDRFTLSPLQNISGWGTLGVPQWIADEFIANDGPDSYRIKGTITAIDDLVYDTYYGYEWIDNLSLEEKKQSTGLGLSNSGLYGQSLYLPLKPIVRSSDMSMWSSFGFRFNNYVIMRYAEVLLMYAEACLMTGDAGTAKNVINQIQHRAGSATISETIDMDVIKREKKIELWMEGCRWPDLVRWGDFEGVMNAGKKVTVLYDRLTREPMETDEEVTFHEDGRFYTVVTHEAIDAGHEVGFKSGKHELFPYPVEVMNANPDLIQNPGW